MKNKGLIIAIAAFAAVDIVALGVVLAMRGSKSSYEYIDAKDYKGKSSEEVSQQVLLDLDQVIADSEENVRAFAAEVQEAGYIRSFSSVEGGDTLSLIMQDGSILVYVPANEGTMSGTDQSFKVLAFDGLDEGVAEMAASWISGSVAEYEEASNNQTLDSVDGIKDALGALGSQDDRIVLWQGHGAMVADPSESQGQACLVLGERAWSDFLDGSLKEDLLAHRLIRTTDGRSHSLAIMPAFIREYMADVDGGLFVCGSCDFLMNNSMEKAFLEKGFHGVIGPEGVVTSEYSNAMVQSIAEALVQFYPDSNQYMSATDALQEAAAVNSALYKGTDFVLRKNKEMGEFYCLPMTGLRGTLLVDTDVRPEDVSVYLTDGAWETTCSVDDEFAFEIWGLDASKECSVKISINGVLVKNVTVKDLEPYKMQQLNEIDVRKHELMITVVDEDQKPVSGATVHYTPAYGEEGYAKEINGSYVADIYPGRVSLEISADGKLAQQMTLENFPEESSVSVTLEVDPAVAAMAALQAEIDESLTVIRENGFGAVWGVGPYISKDYSNLCYYLDQSSVQDMGDYYLVRAQFGRPLTVPSGLTIGDSLTLQYLNYDGRRYTLNLTVSSKEGSTTYFGPDTYSKADKIFKGQEILYTGSVDPFYDYFYNGYLKISKTCQTGARVTKNVHTVTWSDLTAGYSGYDGLYLDDNGMVQELLFMGD